MKIKLFIALIILTLFLSGCAEQPVPETVAVPEKQDVFVKNIVCEQSLSLKRGEKIELAYALEPDDATHKELIIASGNPEIASIDDMGTITANSLGETSITLLAQNGGAKAEILISVTEKAPEKIELKTEKTLSLKYMGTSEAEISVSPADVPIESLIFESTNPMIASIGSDLQITAKSEGSATLTVRSRYDSSVSVRIDVEVTNGPVPPSEEVSGPRFFDTDGIYKNPAAEETGKAKLVFTGDLMCIASQQRAAHKIGYKGSFALVKAILERGDLTVGNLETLVSPSKTTTRGRTPPQAGENPVLNTDPDYLEAVKYAGFDALVTANNHSNDYKETGIRETLFELRKYGFIYTGTRDAEEEKRYVIFDVNGIKVGLLSYTCIRNAGIASKYSYMLNVYSKKAIEKDILDAKNDGAEFIVAYNHWGTENTHKVNGAQKRFAKEMAEAGVDLIIGSHPHCLQRAEMIETEDGGETLCIYSMGNFCSSMRKTVINHFNIILEIDLVRDGEKISIVKQAYYPCKIYSKHNGVPYVVVPSAKEYNGGLTDSEQAKTAERISKVMGDALTAIT